MKRCDLTVIHLLFTFDHDQNQKSITIYNKPYDRNEPEIWTRLARIYFQAIFGNSGKFSRIREKAHSLIFLCKLFYFGSIGELYSPTIDRE